MRRLLSLGLCICLALMCAVTAHAEDMSAVVAAYEASIKWDAVYDVVVAGFGGAGASTAITAADLGQKVLVVEKAPEGHEGGNTRYSAQVVLCTNDAERMHTYLQNLQVGFTTVSDEMLRAYAEGLSENVQWLVDLGANPDTLKLTVGAGAEWPALEGSDSKVTAYIDGEMLTSKFWKLLKQNVEARADKIDVWYNTPAVELIQEPQSGVILGLTVENNGERYNVRAAKGVVLCTGGFECNQEMAQNYLTLPELYPAGTTYNTGDGILMAQKVGANLWHMNNTAGPYLNVINKDTGRAMTVFFQGSSSITKTSSIFVGSDGTRFLNEPQSLNHGYINFHGYYTRPSQAYPAYIIFDQNAMQNTQIFASWGESNHVGVDDGYILSADTLEALAEKIGISAEGLVSEVEKYNGYCEAGFDPQFGRAKDTLIAIGEGPYYAIELHPSVLNTQGGPERNEKAEVISLEGKPIPHLYSAGELGSIWGFIYQGAGNLGECAVFGRIAAQSAAQNTDYAPAGGLVANPVSFVSQEAEAVALKENEFLGTGSGMGGDIRVKVCVEDKKITAVDILSQTETVGIADPALKQMPERIINANNLDVDICTGCTVTSKAILEAVRSALEQAQEKGLYVIVEAEKAEEKKEIVLGEHDYLGTGVGKNGDVTVKVTYKDGKIQAIECVAEEESLGKDTIPVFINRILEAGTEDVDAVTGSTLTCDAIREAVKNALKDVR